MIKTGDCFPVILVVAKQKLFRILFERGVGSHSKPYVETSFYSTPFSAHDSSRLLSTEKVVLFTKVVNKDLDLLLLLTTENVVLWIKVVYKGSVSGALLSIPLSFFFS